MSTITVTGIRAFGYHGVFENERREGQEFVVDIAMAVDTAQAEITDQVADTVDYGHIAELVSKIVSGDPVSLIEKLAAKIADAIMSQTRVEAVTVTVHKPGAPISVPFTDVSVTVSR